MLHELDVLHEEPAAALSPASSSSSGVSRHTLCLALCIYMGIDLPSDPHCCLLPPSLHLPPLRFPRLLHVIVCLLFSLFFPPPSLVPLIIILQVTVPATALQAHVTIQQKLHQGPSQCHNGYITIHSEDIGV